MSIKNEIQLKRLGIKELKDNLTLLKIKRRFPWLLEAKLEDAVIGQFSGGRGVYWYNGKFTGVWKIGIWENGVFEGEWKDGVWQDGVFNGGKFDNK